MNLKTLAAFVAAFVITSIAIRQVPAFTTFARADRIRPPIGAYEDPDDRDLRFRVLENCNHRTGVGSLCHFLVLFKNGEAKQFSDPVCLPIACNARARVIEPGSELGA